MLGGADFFSINGMYAPKVACKLFGCDWKLFQVVLGQRLLRHLSMYVE